MVLAHILTNSLFYGVAVTAYVLVVMVSTSPRVWGYSDYPQVVRSKVPPQTSAEKRLALIAGVPFFDGYFEPLFGKLTGEINDDVAAYWKEHYDLLAYMQRHWATLGPKIVDKLHIYTGDMDTYYLDVGVVLLERWMQQTTDPHYPGFFMYGDRQPHCWSGAVTQAERLREMAQFVLRKQPEGVTAPWWPGTRRELPAAWPSPAVQTQGR